MWFHNERVAQVSGAKGNAMEFGVRDEWIERVLTACDAIAAQAAPRRAQSARALLGAFEKQLPDAKSRAEKAVLRAMLVNVSLQWGHADHWAYHAEFPDAECADDPASSAMTVWHSAAPDARVAFRRWTQTYVEWMERVHPRYRAVELRRDLDTNFTQPLSLARLARTRGVTVRCLQRDFEELTGITIRDYVTERRLDAAVTLLKTTPDKIEWIANVVGWSSRKNFNRALAQRRGVCPVDVRMTPPR